LNIARPEHLPEAAGAKRANDAEKLFPAGNCDELRIAPIFVVPILENGRGSQRERLKDLMARWRAARDEGATLGAAEQAELDQLIEMEVRAATERAVKWYP